MTRDDILDAAAQTFRLKGFHGASMSDIAETVGLQKASLYHHVSSKQEILLDLLDRGVKMLTEQIALIVERPVPADEKLREMIRVYLQMLADNRDLASVLLFEHRSLDKKSHARHVPYRDKFEGLWRDVVNEGARAKIFKSRDPAFATRALIGMLNWTLTWYDPDGSMSIEKIAGQYADLFLDGLMNSNA